MGEKSTAAVFESEMPVLIKKVQNLLEQEGISTVAGPSQSMLSTSETIAVYVTLEQEREALRIVDEALSKDLLYNL